jgi:acyl-CoA thioesterase-1
VSPPERDLRVLFFGDSFVAGTGDPMARGWVGRVVAATWAAGTPMTGYPLGIRRETSIDVAARWRAETRPRLLAGADCRVVFAFGTNDATFEDGRPRVDAQTSVLTLARVLDEARRLGLPAFAVGPPPSCDPAQDDRVAGLSARFASVCDERTVPFVSVVEALRANAAWGDEARAGDGVHPGARGYEALAALVLDGGWPQWLARDPGLPAGVRRRGGAVEHRGQ